MKYLRHVTALLLIIGVLLGLSPDTAADSASEIQRKIQALEQQADEIAAQKQALQDEAAEKEQEILTLTEQKFQIDQEISLLRLEVENLSGQLHQYNLLIAQKQSELEAAQTALNTLVEQYLLRMRAIQEQGEISEWAVIFDSASFTEMLNRRAMVQEIAKADQRMMEDLREAAAEVLRAKDALSAEKIVLEQKRVQQAEAEAALQARRGDADAMLAELASNKASVLRELSALEDEENRLSDQIAQKEQDWYDALHRENQDSGSDSGSTVTPESGFLFPLASSGYVCITDPYGMRYHPITGEYKLHNGVDFAAYLGTPIYASKSGTVTTAESHYIWGNYVVINHGDGSSTLYAHMDYDAVNPGDIVTQGQIIGYVGSSGRSTGPHLHFTIYINGYTVNPIEYVTTPW